MLSPVTSVSHESNEWSDYLAACVQFDVRRGDVASNTRHAEQHIRAAAASGAKLVVLPELWSTSLLTEWPSPILTAAQRADQRLAELSAELDLVLVGSSAEQGQGAVYNRALVLDGGEDVGQYRKLHLFSPNAEDRYMDAGIEPMVAETRAGRLAVAICYDLRFAELTRWFFYRDADLLVVPAQWPESRAVHWRALLDARAVENQCFVLGCNRTGTETSLKTSDQLAFPGNSRIVDPMGEVLATGQGDEGPVVAEIEMRKVRTMRRMMPIAKDRRGDVYRRMWATLLPQQRSLNRQTP